MESNGYSVYPTAIGRRVDIRVAAEEVVVTCGRDVVARHERVLARHVTVTDPAHDAARRARAELARLPASEPAAGKVAERHLADYNRALGVA